MVEPFDSGYAVADGLQIFYRRYGSGSPIVLVHGWGSDSIGGWLDTGWIEALINVREVVTIDVRGHGQSDKPHDLERYRYEPLTTDVLAVMDHLGIGQTDYLGYSMGSFIGAALLRHNSNRFHSMVWGGIGDESEESASMGIVIAEALRAEKDADVTHPYGRAVRRFAFANDWYDAESLACSAAAMWPDGYPTRLIGEHVSDMTLPVLIVNGSDDLPYVLTDEVLATTLPNGELIRIPDCDHMTAVPDQRFKDAVLSFLPRSP